MRVRKLIICLVLIMFMISFFNVISFAASPTEYMKQDMLQDTEGDGQSQLKPIINAFVGLIQIAGTGISLIMVTMLGVRYLLASPSDKADVKRQIEPILTGAVLLFASVQIIQILANFTEKLF